MKLLKYLIYIPILISFACSSPKSDCNCCNDCPPPAEPPPEGPPPSSTVPSDYIRIERIDDILNGTSSSNPGLIADTQFLSWAGWRDAHKVVSECPNDVWYLGTTPQKLSEFGDTGQSIVQESENNWIPRWQSEGPNRRCNKEPDPPSGPGWCQVTNVRKSVWSPWKGSFNAHMDEAVRLRNQANKCLNTIIANGGGAYDSIAGWCSKLKKANITAQNCPN